MESILSQTHQDMESIVVDGASTDGTKNVIIQYEPLFKGRMHWISEPDKGIYDAMNKGLALATGEIIGILNSDDYYKSPDVLKRVNDTFRDNDCDAVFADLEFVAGDSGRVVRFWKGSSYYPHAFVDGWNPAHPTFFVKRTIYEKYGNFDTSFKVSADFELMLRFIEKGNIRTFYIPETFVSMRYGGKSTGTLSAICIGNRNILRAFKKNNIPNHPAIYIFNRMKKRIRQLFPLLS
jgi:glycosyltransferase involved in cell wall biosynthesis